MLVTWRYRKRKSLIQSFDPRAWIIFFACFLVSTLFFWDFRFLASFLVIAVLVLLTSGISWNEIRRAWLFIGGFSSSSHCPDLPDRARRHGSLPTGTHPRASSRPRSPSLAGDPALNITVERILFALSQLLRGLQHRHHDHPDPLLAQPGPVRHHLPRPGAAGQDRLCHGPDHALHPHLWARFPADHGCPAGARL